MPESVGGWSGAQRTLQMSAGDHRGGVAGLVAVSLLKAHLREDQVCRCPAMARDRGLDITPVRGRLRARTLRLGQEGRGFVPRR